MVETSFTDGDSGTPMERVKEGGTAEDASLTVPPPSVFPFFQTLREVCFTQHK